MRASLTRWVLMALGWLVPLATQAQTPTPAPPDTLRPAQFRLRAIQSQNKLLATDSLASSREKKNDNFYRKIKKYLSQKRLLSDFYNLLFRDINAPAPPEEEGKRASRNPNRLYNGRVIGRITVQRLDVFGPNVGDTTRLPRNWFERTANRLHLDTRRHVIQNNYLLFAEGSTFDHQVIINNERLLRNVPSLLDARIIVRPRATTQDTVDILVLTQDVWSIEVDGSVGGLGNAELNLVDKNLFGLGHQLRQGFIYDRGLPQQWGFNGRYVIPYLGRSFTTAEAEYLDQWGNKSYAFRLRKPFLAPTIKYAGGLEWSQNRLLLPLLFPADTSRYRNPIDTVNFLLPVNFRLADGWLGRAFRFYRGSEDFQKSARVVVAARLKRFDFSQGPEVDRTVNPYQSRTTGLVSVGFSRREYFREVFIYGFGRTEDVPHGVLFNLTGGAERIDQVGNRLYAGAQLAYADYFPGAGYFFGNLHVGSYRRQNNWEQGAVQAGLNYFTPLINFKDLQIRQFVTFNYRRGFDRFYNEGIDINNQAGIRGISSPVFRGTQSLVLNFETVVFTRLNWLGFRLAFFGYADLGWVARERNLWQQNPFQGYGLGVRVRNEHLAFNTFQFRLGFYPNVPDNFVPLRTQFSGLPTLRLTDLVIGTPDVVPFR